MWKFRRWKGRGEPTRGMTTVASYVASKFVWLLLSWFAYLANVKPISQYFKHESCGYYMIVIVLFVYLYSLRKLPDVQNPIFSSIFCAQLFRTFRLKLPMKKQAPKLFMKRTFEFIHSSLNGCLKKQGPSKLVHQHSSSTASVHQSWKTLATVSCQMVKTRPLISYPK